MNITFKSSRGECPWFELENIVFFINEVRDGNKYTFQLEKRCTDEERINFDNVEKAYEFIQNENLREFYRGSGMKGYKKGMKIYRLDYKYESVYGMYETENKEEQCTITIRNDSYVIACGFDSYVGCLNYSKEYVARYLEINSNEPKQISLF